jgi:AcrR family transcriptional regulator
MSEAWRYNGPGAPPPQIDGERSRDAIVRAAAFLAAQDGLDGLSIASVAAAAGMSKSRLHAHFGSATELQLATVAEAARIFTEEVVRPALAAPAGLAQLTAVCEAFFAHVERRTSPGGCFMAGAALELGNRPGPLREVIDEFQARFGTLLRGFAATAVHRNELPAEENPDRLAFELNGIMLAADTNFVLHDDPAVLDLARQIVHQRLGVSGG